MGLDHPHTKAGVGEFGVAISGGVWVAIRGWICPDDLVRLPVDEPCNQYHLVLDMNHVIQCVKSRLQNS